MTSRDTRSGGVPGRDVLSRVPPHAEDAEKAVLGAILIDDRSLPRVRPIISAEHFYLEAHRAIFEAMCDLADRGVAIDAVTLSEAMKDRGQFDRFGGAAYLDHLIDVVPLAAHVEDHAEEIRRKFLIRTAILRASQVVADAFESADPVDLSAAFTEAASAVLPPSRERLPSEIVEEFLSGGPTRAVRIPCAGTPSQGELRESADLGRCIGDLYPGQKMLVAARTSEGKTALMRMLWISCAWGAIPDGYITLEDSEEEIVAGAVGGVSFLTSAGVLARSWSSSGRIAGEAVRDWFAKLPMRVLHIPGARPAQVAEAVRAMIVRHGARVIFIDYIQAIAHEGRETRAMQIGQILNDLSRAAGRDAVLVIGSQLSRSPKDQREKEPELEDLRESGRLEEDAKVVLMLRRSGPDSVDSNNRPTGRRGINLWIKKAKFGATGKIGATLWLKHTSLWPGVVRPAFDLSKGPVSYEPVMTPDDGPPPGEMPGWAQQEFAATRADGGQESDDPFGPTRG